MSPPNFHSVIKNYHGSTTPSKNYRIRSKSPVNKKTGKHTENTKEKRSRIKKAHKDYLFDFSGKL